MFQCNELAGWEYFRIRQFIPRPVQGHNFQLVDTPNQNHEEGFAGDDMIHFCSFTMHKLPCYNYGVGLISMHAIVTGN